MDIQSCFKKANEIDDYIDAHFDYAFDEKYGYKTTFPTNTGTGMKAGYTLHLPSLSDARRLNDISAELGRFGLNSGQFMVMVRMDTVIYTRYPHKRPLDRMNVKL